GRISSDQCVLAVLWKPAMMMMLERETHARRRLFGRKLKDDLGLIEERRNKSRLNSFCSLCKDGPVALLGSIEGLVQAYCPLTVLMAFECFRHGFHDVAWWIDSGADGDCEGLL